MEVNGVAVSSDLSPVLETLKIKDPLEAQGELQAAHSLTIKESPLDLAALDASAAGVVHQLPSGPYSPGDTAGDAHRQQEHQTNLEEREIRQAAEAEAESHLRTRRQEAAACDKGLHQAEVAISAYLLFTCVLAVSFSPTFKDEIYVSIINQVTGWLLATITATLVSAAIVWPILAPYVKFGNDAANRLGLGAAVGFGIANFILRESAATTRQDHLLAAGLTAWEAAAVLFVEWYARSYREQNAAWADQEMAKTKAERLVRVAEEQLAASVTHLNAVEAKIAAHQAYLDARQVLHERPADVVAAAKAVARQAYRRTVNRNFGIRIGSEWRKQA